MIFAFRGMKFLQLLFAAIALFAGVGAVLLVKFGIGGDTRLGLPPALLLALVFVWSFTATLRAPTSFVAIAPERTRIRFLGQIDVVVANSDIIGARLVDRNSLTGIGVRTNFRGAVALVTLGGPAAELTFRTPVRFWVLPKILPARATKLTVTVIHPALLVQRFAQPSPAKTGAAKIGSRGPRTR